MIEDSDFPSVNRSLITIYMKQPYVDWINTLREKEEIEKSVVYDLEGINEEPTAYLIAEIFHPSDLELYLERYWIMLFEMQLSGWMLDKKVWPKKRNRKMFNEWFDIKCSSLVIDLWGKDPLQYQD